MTGFGAAKDTPSADVIAAYHNLQDMDGRLHNAGYRLTTANSSFCRDIQMRSGIALHDLGQYQDRQTARTAYGFTGEVAVLAVAHDSPAFNAGVEKNDVITGLEASPWLSDMPLPEKWNNDTSVARFAKITARWEAALNRDRMIFDAHRAITDTKMRFNIVAVPACKSRFQLVSDDNFKASADGTLVTISTRMLEYTNDEDELAAVVAHELAHNILQHLRRLEEAGHTDGLFGSFGRSARLTKQTEIEADRLSVWLMANAGYDPAGAIRFWTRYGKERGKGIFSAPTHYRYKKRVKLFEEEITKMSAIEPGPDGYAPPLLINEFAELK